MDTSASGVSQVKTNLQMSTTVASGKAVETADSNSSFLLNYLRASDYGGKHHTVQVLKLVSCTKGILQ